MQGGMSTPFPSMITISAQSRVKGITHSIQSLQGSLTVLRTLASYHDTETCVAAESLGRAWVRSTERLLRSLEREREKPYCDANGHGIVPKQCINVPPFWGDNTVRCTIARSDVLFKMIWHQTLTLQEVLPACPTVSTSSFDKSRWRIEGCFTVQALDTRAYLHNVMDIIFCLLLMFESNRNLSLDTGRSVKRETRGETSDNSVFHL